MSQFPLLSILYDGDIIRAEDGIKRVKKVYYRYPAVVENGYFYKRFSLRTDEEFDLAIYWHIHHPDIHLLKLFVILIDVEELHLFGNATNTQSTDPRRGLITGMIIDLNVTPERSMNASNSTRNMGLGGSMEDDVGSHQRVAVVEHPMAEPFFVDPILSDDEIDPVVLSEAEAAEMNYFTGSSIAFTQPAISNRYDCPTHFSSLNLDAINEQVFHGQCAPDNDPATEFEVGQEFQNKEAVLMAVKTYNINRAVDYKILESDKLKYAARCVQHD
ncbi:hypothetical protein PIB30_093475 [Stylosanthes scabra]|uniref:Transposase MuDR plant domain-containing protein n=1 Tax=Stylosanthes scabra TaxID=79078 RepID=A0ABU6RVF3_9FABA|nr:hypothetical protein [Stylosanthes scabra]